MTELATRERTKEGVSKDESFLGQTMTGECSSSERETDILEDEDDVAAPFSDTPCSSNSCTLSTENLPEGSILSHADFTNGWIQQQTEAKNNLVSNGEYSSGKWNEKPSPSVAPYTPTRGHCNRLEAQRGGLEEANPCSVSQNSDILDTMQSIHFTNASSCQEAELASLSIEIDDSIEQLNQLVLDLDPTFVPVSTGCAPLSRSTTFKSSGLKDKRNTHLTGWKRKKQISDVTDHTRLWTLNTGLHGLVSGGEGPQWLRDYLVSTPSHFSSQHNCKQNCADYSDQSDSLESVPPTPAFPVSPTTPYVEHFSEFSHIRSGDQWAQHSWRQESRGFLDSANHTGSSIDGELFRSDVSVSTASCPRVFGSMCSVSSSSPLPHRDSCTPPPVWQQPTLNSSQPSTPIKRSTPNDAHSSPWGPPGVPPGIHMETDSTDLPSLLTVNGNLEHSLLEAMGDLRDLNLGGDGDLPPLLPEKRRAGEGGDLGSCLPCLSGFSSPHSESSLSLSFSSLTPDPFKDLSGSTSPGAEFGSKQDTVKFVQDTSKFWYKPDISRDQAISVLKDKEPGSFIVRDSHSFRGAYGLAMKVATPPPSVLHQSKKVGVPSNELVRHFLIECTQKGVRLKGCPDEPFFGSLTALVCQHSITPLALPCKLILPNRDPFEDMSDSPAKTATNSAAELLKQGAACNVWYLGSVELESLTGHQAVQKATTVTLSMDPPSASTVVHFKVSAQGITLTDNQRKLFFRRHYAVNTVIFCSLDPQGRRWTRGSGSTAKIFGFVARKSQSETENICHLFAEHDPEQPASAIVNFVAKVMIGSHKK
ncbi:si:ch211-191a24.3 isoform X2 [Phycodurus eques]|uniref:si:ch211-191a24.3 isoform X2 n=1 Tax=Phycodurus eques TaxID=693459 RepID=UPI002ACD2822|nr:si:ch211-191a24.3 isoform X2 [Phycodurus eques]